MGCVNENTFEEDEGNFFVNFSFYTSRCRRCIELACLEVYGIYWTFGVVLVNIGSS